MTSTVRPLALTAPEYFMCFFSTVLGVTDVGISAFLGTNAFTACIERGIFIYLAGSLGEIDWFIGYREMLTYAFTLLAIALCILDNSIVLWNTIVMILIYIVYWLFMQFNKVIERRVKDAVAGKKEEDPRLDDNEITELHRIKRREIVSTPESILQEKYALLNGYIVCKQKDIERKVLVKQVEGVRPKLAKFYSATNKILCGIAHRKLKEQIDRATFNVDVYKSSRSGALETKPEIIRDATNKGEEGEYKIYPMDSSRGQQREVVAITDRVSNNKDLDLNPTQQQELEHYKSIKAMSSDNEYYDDTINMQWKALVWPKTDTWYWKAFYIVMLPITSLLYVTIPNPRIPRGDEISKLPLVYLICLVWMGVFSYFITWWLVILSISFEIPFLILPMIILPLGLMLRDFPHWLEFSRSISRIQSLIKYENELKEKVNLYEAIGKKDKYTDELKLILINLSTRPHKEVIQEQYSGPIFSLTLGSSVTWLVYIILEGDIELYSNSIWVQLLLLMAVIIVKLVFITHAKFKTPRSLFYEHLAIYICYIVFVMVVEFAT